MQLHGKTAVVVGGTHGIGLATARALLDRGAEVLLTGGDPENVRALEGSLGPKAHVLRSNVTVRADIEQLAQSAARVLKAVDLVFYNAGIAELAAFATTTEEAWERQFAVNAKGAFFTVQRLAPLVRDGGAVVFTSSVADEGGTPGMSVYSASKAALVSFASVMASELLPRRIRVNCVSPGFIDTKTMGAKDLTPAERAGFMAMGDAITPLRRHGSAEEVAEAVLYLGFAATFTTGAKLPVDGGLGQRLRFPEASQ